MTEWTVETLHHHVVTLLDVYRQNFIALLDSYDQRYIQRFTAQDLAVKDALAAQEKAVAAALAAADRAVAKAENASEKRFESVNEFRAALKDQQIGLVSRAEVDAEIRALRTQIDELKSRFNRSEGRTGGLQAGGQYLVAGVGLLFTLLGIGSLIFAFMR